MKKRQKYKGFNLVEDTRGKIIDGVYVKEDFSEFIIAFAWGEKLHFKPENLIKITEKRALIGKPKK